MIRRFSTNGLIVICAAGAALIVTAAELCWIPSGEVSSSAWEPRSSVGPLPRATVQRIAKPGDLLPAGCTGGWTAEESGAWTDALGAAVLDSRPHPQPHPQPPAHAQTPTQRGAPETRTIGHRYAAPVDPQVQHGRNIDDSEDLLLPAPKADPLDALELLSPLDVEPDPRYPETDPLEALGPPQTGEHAPPSLPTAPSPPAADVLAHADPHAELFLENCYPSAQTCAKCHPKHYDQWRVSSHAYASISPMFQRFEQLMQDLTQGTVGAFCVRCHAPVATQLGIASHVSILDAPPVIREGITCIACHRVHEAYGRTHGDRRIEPGDIHAPVNGSSDGSGIRQAFSMANELKLKLLPHQTGPGQSMHAYAGFFAPLSRSDFCAPCHQVAVHPGIGLEIVHAQFRAGPAHAKGITCQDCHMGAVPGKPEGYEHDYCAIINDRPFGEPRKHANHMFWGPNYSIAHPGIFPHNKDAGRYTPRQWLAFEYRSGWGTPEFERSVPPGRTFPAPWDTADDRIDGRKLIDANQQQLSKKRDAATMTLAAGGRVVGPFFHSDTPTVGRALKFSYRVENISEGHNLPTGSLGAQPQLWLNAVLVGPAGKRIWETGYLDSNGDLADLNSIDVAQHRLPRDAQLFNLQTKFLINNIRGTDREAPVPLNFSLDQLVFLRPGAVPVSVLNHPPLIRMEAHSIEPLGHRVARYRVPAERITQPGEYRLSVRLRSRPEPPYFMRLVGASPEMIRRLNENIIDIEASSKTFLIRPR